MLDDLGFGFGSFPKELPLGLRPVPPATRKDCPGAQFRKKSCKTAQDGLEDASKTAKMPSKTAKMASRCLQDGPRCTQDGLRRPQDGPRRPERPPRGLQDCPRGLEEVLQEGSKRPNSFILRRFWKDFGFPVLSALRRFKIAQETSKSAPRSLQYRPKTAQ